MAQIQQAARGLTIREFAKRNSLGENTVRKLVNAGKVPSYKIGRSRRIPAEYDEGLRSGSEIEVAAEKLVASWPDLTDEQLDRIAGLLRSVVGAENSAPHSRAG